MKNKRNTSKEKQKRNKGFPYRISSLFGKKKVVNQRKKFPKCAYCGKAMRKEDEVAYYHTLKYHSECLTRKKSMDIRESQNKNRKAAMDALKRKREERNDTKTNN